jgi:glycosyltransferase involved in cell wall biosynthesis
VARTHRREPGRRPSVLLLNWRDTRHPEGGGSERYIERIAGLLARRGYRVTMLCSRHAQAPAGDWAQGVRFRRAGGRYTVYLRALLALLRSDADLIVDVQNGMPFFSSLVARCPVIVLVHHVHREQWRSMFGELLGRVGWLVESRLAPLLYRRSHYVAVSEVTRRELAELGVDARRTAVIRNGLDPVPATTSSVSRTPRLVVVSRLVAHKRIEHAIEVVARLRQRWPDLTLDVIGHGSWASVLAEHAQRLGVADNVVLHGWVDEQTKHELIATAWLHLCPSVKEGWGIAVAEAAAHGVPTVAYADAGGVAESMQHQRTGLLARDLDDFVACAELLLADDELRRAMGAAGRARAARWSWEHSADQFDRLLRELGGFPAPQPYSAGPSSAGRLYQLSPGTGSGSGSGTADATAVEQGSVGPVAAPAGTPASAVSAASAQAPAAGPAAGADPAASARTSVTR